MFVRKLSSNCGENIIKLTSKSQTFNRYKISELYRSCHSGSGGNRVSSGGTTGKKNKNISVFSSHPSLMTA